MECLKKKCPNTHNYILWILTKSIFTNFYNLPPTFVNSLPLSTTLRQFLPTISTFFTPSNFIFCKEKVFLKLPQNHNLVQLILFLNLCLCVRTFCCIVEKVLRCGAFNPLRVYYGTSYQPLTGCLII